jgi:glycosyltransferase involved in cell wall biosynthesis
VNSLSSANHNCTVPLVSWILCTKQDDALLDRAVRSCLSQTLTEFELLLVVNGPDYLEILSALRLRYTDDARVRIVDTPIYLLNFSLSLGLHLAKAKYVARMDADDVAEPVRLERQWSYMESHPKVAVLGTSYHLIDSVDLVHGHVSCPTSNDEIRRSLFYRNPICHPSVMLRREVVIAKGGYLGGQNAEDYDLWLRICLDKDLHFANLPDYLLSYNVDPGGAARRSKRAYANVAAAQIRNFLITRDIRWFLGAILTAMKSLIRSNRA